MDSPLGMQFSEFDADKDGKITDTQTYELLKMLGKNTYTGAVKQAIRFLNYENPSLKTINFNQFKEYFDSFETQSKQELWKLKYECLTQIQELTQFKKDKEGGLAAPGANPAQNQSPLEGNITMKIGPQNAVYQSSVEIELQKKMKEQAKPFIKIIFEQQSQESAVKLGQFINQAYKMIIQLIKGESPEDADLFQSFHLMTNPNGKKLNIFITSSYQMLIELGILYSQFLDKVLGAPFDAYASVKYHFNVDIPKFLEEGSNYTFYDAVTKNIKTQIKWSGMNFKANAKELLKHNDAFGELKYDKMEPFALLLIGILHLELCELDLSFDNSEFTNPELESKAYILESLGQFVGMLKELEQEKSLELKGIFENIHNKFSIEAQLGNWTAKANINIKNLNQLLTTKMQ